MTSGSWGALPSEFVDVYRTSTPGVDALLASAAASDPLEIVPPQAANDADLAFLFAVADGIADPRSEVAAIERCLWSRWWTFAEGFRQAVKVPDLHLLAGVLRSWEEELDVLEWLAPIVTDPDVRPSQITMAAQFLASRGDESREADSAPPRQPTTADYRAVLNSLLHPNLLGHLAVMDPAQPQLLRGLVGASQAIARRAYRIPVGSASPTLKMIKGHSPARSTKQLIPFARNVLRAVEHGPQSEVFAPLNLGDRLADYESGFSAGVGTAGAKGAAGPPLFQSAEHPATRTSIDLARRAWEAVHEAYGAWNQDEEDIQARLGYLERLAEAVHTALDARIGYHEESLLRAIAVQNPLLVSLAARAVLEHQGARGFAMRLAMKNFRQLKTRPDDQVAQTMELTERPLLRLLVGGQHERTGSALEQRAETIRATASVAIEDMLRSEYADGAGTATAVWSRLSEVVHGQNGALNPRRHAANHAVMGIGLIVLAEGVSETTMLDRAVPSVEFASALASLGVALESGASVRSEVRRQAVPDRLAHGRHYSGNGTFFDPYVLKVGAYLQAFHPLLRHLGVDDFHRETVRLPDGRIADRVSSDTGTIYIVDGNPFVIQ